MCLVRKTICKFNVLMTGEKKRSAMISVKIKQATKNNMNNKVIGK